MDLANITAPLKISPSILSADFRRLGNEIEAVQQAGADLIHCDVMDGHFVPNITIGPFIIEAVKKVATVPLDVHLMISNPQDYITSFRTAGADIITVHAEACTDLAAVLGLIRESGARVGVTVNPDVAVDLFLPFLSQIDQVLIMSVFAGFPGQSFIPQTMMKVKTVRDQAQRLGLSVDIEVDGGINAHTAETAVAHGANVLVAGSYIYGSDNYEERIRSIRRAGHKGMGL